VRSWLTSSSCEALVTLPIVSTAYLASIAVETVPGTICKISLPNSTCSRSRAASICSLNISPLLLPYSIAISSNFWCSGFLIAARMKEKLVVTLCGLYFLMAAISATLVSIETRAIISAH